MIRAAIALSAACALSACGLIGPAQPDVERAFHAYYANGTPENAPDLHEATLTEFEGCVPRNGFYKCPMVFQTSAARVPAVVTLERDSNGWRIQHIALDASSR